MEKPESEIVAEVQAIIRQITASVTFLPLLDESCVDYGLQTAAACAVVTPLSSMACLAGQWGLMTLRRRSSASATLFETKSAHCRHI